MSDTNNSTALGFLTPTSLPIEDPELMDVLTATVVGITSLDPTLVRPRWQSTAPNQPRASVNWCSVGVIRRVPNDYPYIVHDPAANDGKGQDVMTDYEELGITASFYGPNAYKNAGIFRRGINVSQNRDLLGSVGVKVTEIGEELEVPQLENIQWINRVDVSIRMTREMKTTFNVYTILSVPVQVHTDSPSYVTSQTDTPPE